MKAPVFSAISGSKSETKKLMRDLRKVAQKEMKRPFYIENHSVGAGAVVYATDKKAAREEYLRQFPHAANERFTAYVAK